jgi:hypothetical protein
MTKKVPVSMQDVFERNKYDLATAVSKSRGWFDKEVAKLAKQQYTPKKVLNGDFDALTQRIVPGNLYMYFYDAKLKEELPYWDRFPLVFPFRSLPDGFIGLNMHYLPYNYRIKLLDALLDFRSNNRMDETTKLKYSWQLIDGVSRYKAAEPCVKRYLTTHVRSQYRKVESSDWATAMLLPVESFIGASKNKVFKDSINKITGL